MQLKLFSKTPAGTTILTAEDPAVHHASLSRAPNGLVSYRQRGQRKTPTGWTSNRLHDQPVMPLDDFAARCVQMFLDSAKNAMAHRFADNYPNLEADLSNALCRAVTQNTKSAPRARDIRTRLQRHFRSHYAKCQQTLDTLEELLPKGTRQNCHTLNQYNAVLAIPSLLADAAEKAPHILTTYLNQTVHILPTPCATYPETLQEMARLTGWAAISRTVRTRPTQTSAHRLRIAASAVRDARVPDHCSTLAQAIWAETELHCNLKDLDDKQPGAWDRWTEIIALALSNHPNEISLHRENQPGYQGTLETGSAEERARLIGRVSCLSKAASVITAGERLTKLSQSGRSWTDQSWANHLAALPLQKP